MNVLQSFILLLLKGDFESPVYMCNVYGLTEHSTPFKLIEYSISIIKYQSFKPPNVKYNVTK